MTSTTRNDQTAELERIDAMAEALTSHYNTGYLALDRYTRRIVNLTHRAAKILRDAPEFVAEPLPPGYTDYDA